MTTVSRTPSSTPTLFTTDDGKLSILWPDGTTQELATKNVGRRWLKTVVDKALWKAAATSQQLVIATLPAKTRVLAAYLDTTTKLAGLAGTIALSLGTSGDSYAGLIAQGDVKTAIVTQGLAVADLGTDLAGAAALTGSATAISGLSASVPGGTQVTASTPAEGAALVTDGMAVTGDVTTIVDVTGLSINAPAAPIQGGKIYSFSATQDIKLQLASGTGNIGNGTVTNLTTGSTTVYLLIETLP